jgi:hypothetical protein
MLGDNPINWMNKKLLFFFTTKAEYCTLLEGAKEIVWLRRLSIELEIGDDAPTKLYINNQSSMKLVKNLVLHAKTKHKEISYHYIRERVQDGIVKINYISIHEQIVDLLTKLLSKIHFDF